MLALRFILPWGVVLLSLAGLAACEMQRTEYRRRPAYYREAAVGELPDRVELEDGTVIVYETRDPTPQQSRRSGEAFKTRKENEDGTITLRAIIPEHILTHLLTCLHNEEYELVYDELLAQQKREEWERAGYSPQDFVDYLALTRSEMIRAVNRILLGMSSFETVLERGPNGMIQCRLRPQGAKGLKFSRVTMVTEGMGLKLLNVE